MQAFWSTLWHTSTWLFYPLSEPYKVPAFVPVPVAFHQVGPVVAWHFEGPSSLQVVHFHGNSESLNQQVSFLAPWLELGFEAWAFDYRGFGESKGYATVGRSIEDGLQVLKKMEHKDTLLFCQSLGVPLCLMAAAKWLKEDKDANKRLKGFILEGGFISLREAARAVLSHVHCGALSRLLSERHMRLSDLGPLGSIPAIVVHGEEDQMIPLRLGKELYDAYPGPKMWVPSSLPVHLGHVRRDHLSNMIAWLLSN
jgi:uncharacterized protein